MNALSESELDLLPLHSLVQRMDDFLLQAEYERYGQSRGHFPVALPSEIVNSKAVQQRSDEEIRKIAHLAFSYLVELGLNSVTGGFANRILYTQTYTLSDWTSPVFRLRQGAIQQYEIVSSRIAFEVFMDILHVIETGRRIQSKKSKLRIFRTWLQDIDNRFHYFAHVLIAAYEFDRKFRTPEVHGASRLPRKMLLLQVPSHEENNQPLHLTNALAGVWRPLIDILNNVRPNYMHISQTDEAWFQTYISGDDDAIEEKLEKMLDNLK